jgi:uncharacterized coiled-coil DUF342 family protein
VKTLTKDHKKQREELISKLDNARGELNSAITDFNNAVESAKEPVTEAWTAYNEIVQEANALLEELASDAQNYFDERSEKWQEGDAGEQYNQWIEQFQEEICEIDEIDFPSELEEPDLDEAIDKLENLVERPTEM